VRTNESATRPPEKFEHDPSAGTPPNARAMMCHTFFFLVTATQTTMDWESGYADSDSWIARWCFNNEDPITLQQFARLPKNIRQTIVSIFEDDVDGITGMPTRWSYDGPIYDASWTRNRGHCFLIDSIFRYIAVHKF
jgi:hypothetical protein